MGAGLKGASGAAETVIVELLRRRSKVAFGSPGWDLHVESAGEEQNTLVTRWARPVPALCGLPRLAMKDHDIPSARVVTNPFTSKNAPLWRAYCSPIRGILAPCP